MAYIYCLVDEKKDHALVKIGYSTNLFRRLAHYDTHNAELKFIGACECYKKTAHGLEKEFQAEIEKIGFSRLKGSLMRAETEWFAVGYDNQLYIDLMDKGMKAFRTTKNRKIYNPFNVVE